MSYKKFKERKYSENVVAVEEETYGMSYYNDEKNIEEMTKIELDEYAKKNGVELDRRQSKSKMIQEYLNSKEEKK